MLAIHLGAETGRAVLGWPEGGYLQTEEIHRFPNEPIHLPDGLRWNILSLYKEIWRAIDEALAARGTTGLTLVSVGIDSWGVDYGLLDGHGTLTGPPFHHRDPRTLPQLERVHERMSEQALYEATGVRSSPANTLFQLLADQEAGRLEHAGHLLLIPDLIAYWLTGVPSGEATIASTTQLLDPFNHRWSRPVIEAFDLPERLFPELTPAGSVRGRLIDRDDRAIGDVSVINVASHDTASAFVAADAPPGSMVISAGTWFLVGREQAAPIVTPDALAAGFTNELGYGGTIRFVKNGCGLWLLQEARRFWQREGQSASYANLAERAAVAAPLYALFDPDDPRFYAPGPMNERIAAACQERGDPAPASTGEVVRAIIDSLAMSMRRALDDLIRVTGEPVEQITIVGGGTKNALLCQAIADATNCPVVTGPAEATAVGSLLVQGITNGFFADLAAARAALPTGAYAQRFAPSADRDTWEAGYRRFLGAR